jgi:hypothetical protein
VLKVQQGGNQLPSAAVLSAGATRELARHFAQLRRSEPGTESRATALVYLTEAILKLMQGDIRREPRQPEMP